MEEWRCPLCGKVLRGKSKRILWNSIYRHKRKEVEDSGLFEISECPRRYVSRIDGTVYYSVSLAWEALADLLGAHAVPRKG